MVIRIILKHSNVEIPSGKIVVINRVFYKFRYFSTIGK